MKYINSTIKRYLRDLGSDLPAPGGGSASGVAAALGVSLLQMVASFTKKNTKTMCSITKKLRRIKRELEKLADEDVKAYNKLSKLFKRTNTSSARRKMLVQKQLKVAAAVPFKICEYSYIASKTANLLLKEGNKNLITDVGCGVVLLKSAFIAGRLNVEINLKYIKDNRFVQRVRKALDTKERNVRIISNRVLASINRSLR